MPASVDEALALVAEKFRGLTDKDGEPYVMHCLRVMMDIEDPDARLVGLMHDLVEDTEVTLEDLRQRGFAESVVAAIDLVTHRSPDSYADYVVRLKSNSLAKQAKLSDLRDNASLERVLYRAGSADSDLRRIQRYVLSYQFLRDRLDEASYRNRMAALE